MAEGAEVDALRSGDEAAFMKVIQRLHGSMLRLAVAYVGDHHVAVSA